MIAGSDPAPLGGKSKERSLWSWRHPTPEIEDVNGRYGQKLVFFDTPWNVSSMAEAAPTFTFQHSAASALGHITYTGFGVRQDVALGQPRVLGTYAIVYFLEGQGTYPDANGYEHRIMPGDLLILFPDLEHIYNPDKGTAWITSFM